MKFLISLLMLGIVIVFASPDAVGRAYHDPPSKIDLPVVCGTAGVILVEQPTMDYSYLYELPPGLAIYDPTINAETVDPFIEIRRKDYQNQVKHRLRCNWHSLNPLQLRNKHTHKSNLHPRIRRL